MGEFVRLEVESGVGTIRIDRPKMNALDAQVQRELTDAAREADTRTDVAAVVFYGGERLFAAGADVKEMADMSREDMESHSHLLQDFTKALAGIGKPTVAAITGFALGGGLEVALTADVRFAAEDAKVGQPEILLGIIPGAGGTQRLARLIGAPKAKELIYTGRFVDAASEAADRASGLTRRLLAFSRRQDIEPESLEADAFLAQCAEIARRTVGRSLRFEVDLAAPGARILVDPSQLENAILNLAINARDAMPEGGTLRLTSALVDAPGTAGAGGTVEIALSDTGTGMPDEVLAQARAPFFTTKAAGEGTGLGLSQVAGFCERSGGRMEIDSRIGQGTVVRLCLPITATPAGSRIGSDEVPVAPTPGIAVLVVDDEPAVRMTTVAMLRDLGYRVVDAADAAEGLALVATMPDLALVVSDVVMPGGDGASLVRDATRVAPGLRGLLVTGLESEAPADGIPSLAKPYDLGQLARAVRAALPGTEPAEPGRGIGLAA